MSESRVREKGHQQGRFISFEGIDGSGKSTQARLLVEELQRRGVEVVTTREPGGTVLGEGIRHILQSHKDEHVCNEAEVLLFAASRAQLVRQVLRPALTQGKWVVADRFIDSSLAYQGFGRGVGVEKVRLINELALDGLWPDRTFLIDLPVELAQQRRRHRPEDRIEAAGLEFQGRVRQGYLELVEADPKRWQVFPGEKSVAEVARLVMATVEREFLC